MTDSHTDKAQPAQVTESPHRRQGERLAVTRLLAACDRLEAEIHEGPQRDKIREIREIAGELGRSASRTELMAGSALRMISSDLPLNALESALNDMKILVGAERGYVLLRSPEVDSFDRIETEGLVPLKSPDELRIADELARKVYESDEPILNPDIGMDPQFASSQGSRELSRQSILIVPLAVDVEGRRERMGVVYVDVRRETHVFSDSDRWLLQSFASLAALSIRNVRLTANLRLAYQDTVHALVKALEAKDPYTRGHSERVAEYAERCAKRFALGMTRIEVLHSAALLHDIGKIGIRENILKKPGKLTADEFDHVKRHPEISESILMGLIFLIQENAILSQHHERYDGKGYPRGLKGDEISLEGAIIQVADAWDAMTSQRVYSGKMDMKEALDQIHKNAGTQFNPRVVEVFTQMIEEEGMLPVEELSSD